MDTQDLMGDDYTKPAPVKKDHTRWTKNLINRNRKDLTLCLQF